MRIRTEVLGVEHVERSNANATDLDRPFLEWITTNVWGDLWADPTLDRKTRSMITIAILAAPGPRRARPASPSVGRYRV